MRAASRRYQSGEMVSFQIPTVVTVRLRLRAFRAADLDAYAAMQANLEVMRHRPTGRAAICDAS